MSADDRRGRRPKIAHRWRWSGAGPHVVMVGGRLVYVPADVERRRKRPSPSRKAVP